ncbi:MAG TPA: hypothetical protein VFA67_13065 [Candidatus Sulfotelmatobacter sp.]|nr:hypothetical protein [Candidatus Sulfotelmatobacter sp.]
MVKFEGSASKVKFWTRLAATAAWCLLAVFLTLAPAALAQGTSEFDLSATSLDPVAIFPGGTSSSSIMVTPATGFTGTVALTCQVTATQPTTSTPGCSVSPATVTPPATATATITSTTQTTTVGYSVTITGTGPTTTFSPPPLQLTVLAVTPQFTITIQNALAPNSVPAGSGAEGTISVNPMNGYLTPANGGITLYCSSITPLVTIAPVCSFTYPGNASSLTLGANPETATLTISTFGPVTTGAAAHPRSFYALWLSMPLLGLVGIGTLFGGKRSRKACALLAIVVVSASILLLPSCSSTTATSTTTPNGVTPANTYTFTIVGIDSDGVISSNAGTSTSAPSVSLAVTAPTKP